VYKEVIIKQKVKEKETKQERATSGKKWVKILVSMQTETTIQWG